MTTDELLKRRAGQLRALVEQAAGIAAELGENGWTVLVRLDPSTYVAGVPVSYTPIVSVEKTERL